VSKNKIESGRTGSRYYLFMCVCVCVCVCVYIYINIYISANSSISGVEKYTFNYTLQALIAG
jgi:hypothetical protein